MDFSGAEQMINSIETSSRTVLRGIAAEVAEMVTPLVRGILAAKYDASGMKSKSGKMIDAINNTMVFVKISGRKPSIVYALPSNIAGYGGKAGFYQIFTGLSYGSVRGLSGANKKEKRGIKKIALKGKTGIVGQFQYGDGKTKAVSESGAVSAGSVVVTKPRGFWVMSNSEQATVRAAVLSGFRDLLARRAKQ